MFRYVASGAKTNRVQLPRPLSARGQWPRALRRIITVSAGLSANRPHRSRNSTLKFATVARYVAGRACGGVQRNVRTGPASLGEADLNRSAPIPGIRPDLLLIKQVDQVSALNGRLSPIVGWRDLHRIVGMTYSTPGWMPVGQGRSRSLRRVQKRAPSTPCTAMSPNSERFQPPRLWKAIGHRDRHVGAGHADPDAAGEFARRVVRRG